MFDLIALAFDADITRSVAFMLNREDGMGISDTFPLKLGLGQTHHNLSHAEDKDGQLAFAKYDLFLSEQMAHFLGRLTKYKDRDGSVLDNTIVLFGSGASTTHNPTNLPTLIAGGANMGLKHGTYWRKDDTRMSNVYLSILRSLGIEQESFADSTGTLERFDLQSLVVSSRNPLSNRSLPGTRVNPKNAVRPAPRDEEQAAISMAAFIRFVRIALGATSLTDIR